MSGGVNSSADATRTETIGFEYRFRDLLAERKIDSCEYSTPFLIQGNLKIGEFISNKANIAAVPGTVANNGSPPFSTFTYEVTFVVIYGGSVTPTWKFVELTALPSSPFLFAQRTKTHVLTVTLGKADSAPKTARPKLSPEAENAHLAAQIGQAVATAIQSQQSR